MSKKRSWTSDQLKIAVQKSTSFAQVLKALRLIPAGGNYHQIQRYIKEYSFDTKHFKGQGWNKGLRGIGKPIFSLEEILVANRPFQSYKLKHRLIKAKLKPPYC